MAHHGSNEKGEEMDRHQQPKGQLHLGEHD
jgi:hypothetical protein